MFKSHQPTYRTMSTSTGILGGALGAGLTYTWLKPKITRLERENAIQVQQINALQNEVRTLRNTVSLKENIITQKDEAIRQKDNMIAIRDAEITKLKEERKHVLSN